MNYDLTPERRDYINARGYTLLTACPGSGKTTSIAYKLGELAVHSNDNVLCLSFTNNAVNELDEAYNQTEIASSFGKFLYDYLSED